MRSSDHQSGFSLVELTTAMVASLLLVMSFSSVVVFSRHQLTEARTRIGFSNDQVVIDNYIRSKLTGTISDSMKIYTDADAQATGIASETGAILRAVDPDSTVFHLQLNESKLLWMEGSTAHLPIDSDVSGLCFTEQTGLHGKTLSIRMKLSAAEDTLDAAWSLSLRN